VKDFCVHIALE